MLSFWKVISKNLKNRKTFRYFSNFIFSGVIWMNLDSNSNWFEIKIFFLKGFTKKWVRGAKTPPYKIKLKDTFIRILYRFFFKLTNRKNITITCSKFEFFLFCFIAYNSVVIRSLFSPGSWFWCPLVAEWYIQKRSQITENCANEGVLQQDHM